MLVPFGLFAVETGPVVTEAHKPHATAKDGADSAGLHGAPPASGATASGVTASGVTADHDAVARNNASGQTSVDKEQKRTRGFGRRLFGRGLSFLIAGIVALSVVAAALAAVTAAGFLPLSGLENRISSAIEERLGKAWNVKVANAQLGRVDGRSAVRIADISMRHDNGVSIRAPEAVLSYDPLALLTGRVRVTGIDLRGVNLRLGVDSEGAITFEAGSSAIKLGQGMTGAIAADDSNALMFALLSAVDIIASESGELSAIESARLTGAKLSLVDENGRERIGFDNVNIRMLPVEPGLRRLDISARGPSGVKEFSIDLRSGEGGLRQASLDLRRFEPSDVFALILGDGWGGIEGLALSGRVSVETTAVSAPLVAKMDLRMAAGNLRIPALSPQPVPIDGGRLVFGVDSNAGVAQIEALSFKSGATDLTFAGPVVRAKGTGQWVADLTGKGIVAGERGDADVRLDKIDVSLLGGATGDLELRKLVATGPAASVSMNAVIRSFAENPAAELTLSATESEVRAALALWPAFVSPEIRKVLVERLRAGVLERLDIALNFPPDVLKAAQSALAVPDDSIKVTAKGRAVTFLIDAGLPLLKEAGVSAITTGRTLVADIASAKADLGKGRFLVLSDGAFSIADTYATRAIGKASFRATGGADALASLLARPVLREFAPGQLDPDILKGSIDLRSTITLPLADDIRPAEVSILSSGQLINIASDSLIPREKLEAGNLKMTYDKGNLAMKGDARLSGLPSQIEIRLDPKGDGEAALMTVLDQAARQRRGMNVEGQVIGPVSVRLTKALGRNSEQNPRVEIDLAKAAIEGALPGWSKPAGRAGKVAFSFSSDNDGVDLDDFLLESAPVFLRGKMSLNKQMGFESASFGTAKLSPGDDLKLDLNVDGNVTKATIRGKVFDARPFLKLASKEAKADPDVDVDLNVPIVTGFNNEAIGNAVVKASRRKGEFQSLAVDGKIGKASLSARINRGAAGAGAPPLVVETEDGGGLMRFYDVYRRAYGGELILNLTLGDSKKPGTLLYRDFVVRNEPALRRVLAEGSSTSGIGGDRATAGPRTTDASEVAFTKLKADFFRSASRIELKEAVMWGPLLGFTAQGSVDFARDRIDIAGTFVPSYAFNNAFSQVPIFGQLLGGGQYEGLFAVNFRLGGSAAQPTVSINPLSAIAPGILRRFVDPGGGSPLGLGGNPGARRAPER
jgi:hypothetical protein